MPSPPPNNVHAANRRRSQRVLLRMPIDVIALTTDNRHVSESTFTLVVNAHGALIQLTSQLIVSQIIIVKNPETSEEQACRVVHSSPSAEGKFEVGLEFVRPAPNFWRVSFPPSDWAPHQPEITSDTF